jgi:signal transduction histidine kinase
MKHVERASAVVMMLSGLYLAWYWLNDIRDNYSDDLTGSVIGWQERVARNIDENRTMVAIVLAVVVIVAIVFARGLGRRSSENG